MSNNDIAVVEHNLRELIRRHGDQKVGVMLDRFAAVFSRAHLAAVRSIFDRLKNQTVFLPGGGGGGGG